MKQGINKYLIMAATAGLLASCAGEDSLRQDDPGRLLVKEVLADDAAGNAIRAVSALTAGTIGIFRAGDTGATPTYPTECNNYPYAYATDGWKPVNVAQTIYLTGKDIGVCAYYPYQDDPAYADKTALPLTSGRYEGTDAVNDICYAGNQIVNATTAKRSVSFTMSHAMALLELVFYREAGATTVAVNGVSLGPVCSSATLNITTGVYTPGSMGNLSYNPSLTMNSVNKTATSSVLLVPCTIDGGGLKLEIKVVAVNTSFVTIPASLFGGELKAGKRYRVKIAVNGMKVDGVEVLDWITTNIDNGGNPYPI